MKRKDIEKKLKIEAEQFVPDPLDKIKMAARAENLLPYDSELNSEVYSQGNTAIMAKSRRHTPMQTKVRRRKRSAVMKFPLFLPGNPKRRPDFSPSIAQRGMGKKRTGDVFLWKRDGKYGILKAAFRT